MLEEYLQSLLDAVAAHHPALESYPHHKHVRSETTVIPAEPPQLRAVLQEIEQSYPLG